MRVLAALLLGGALASSAAAVTVGRPLRRPRPQPWAMVQACR